MAVMVGDAVGLEWPAPDAWPDPALATGEQADAGMVAAFRAKNHADWRAALWTWHACRSSAGTTVRVRESRRAGKIAAASLGWAEGTGAARLEFARQILERLPALGEAMREGWLEERKAAIFVNTVADLDDEQARRVVERLLGRAPEWTHRQLQDRVEAEAMSIDPSWAEARKAAAIARRRMLFRVAPSGAAELSGFDLPPEPAQDAYDRIVALADVVHDRLRGLGRDAPAGPIQTEVFLVLTGPDGPGLWDDDVIELVIERLTTDPDPHPGDGADGGPDPGPDDGPNGGPDSGSDDGPNGGPNGGPNDGPSDGPESGPDDGPDGGPDSGPDDGPNGGPDGGSGSSPGDRSSPGSGGAPGSGLDDPGQPDGGRGSRPARGPGARPGDDAPPAAEGGLDGAAGPADRPEDRSGAGDESSIDCDPDESTDSDADPAATDKPGVRRAVPFRARVAIRLGLGTVMGLDQRPGDIPDHGSVCASTARTMAWARTHTSWRVHLYTDHGHLDHVLTVRPPTRGSPNVGDRRRKHVVELTAHTRQLDDLLHGRGIPPGLEVLDPGALTLLTRADQALAAARARPPSEHPAVSTADAHRRRPSTELARWVRARDRTCRSPGCTRQATGADLDHTLAFDDGGHTTADDLGVLCEPDHLLKHDPTSGWTLTQPRPGTFVWTAPTGREHVITEEPHNPLPAPLPPADGSPHSLPVDVFVPPPHTPDPGTPRRNRHGHITHAARNTADHLARRARKRAGLSGEGSDRFPEEPPF